jgi:hypothetical protein
VLVLTGDWLDEEGVEDASSPAGVGGEAGGGAMGMGASTELLWWKAGTQREKGGAAFAAADRLQWPWATNGAAFTIN